MKFGLNVDCNFLRYHLRINSSPWLSHEFLVWLFCCYQLMWCHWNACHINSYETVWSSIWLLRSTLFFIKVMLENVDEGPLFVQEYWLDSKFNKLYSFWSNEWPSSDWFCCILAIKSLCCFAVQTVQKKTKKEVIDEKKQKTKAEELAVLEKVRFRRDHVHYCVCVCVPVLNWQKLRGY